ncbi:uncharacterized protein LOC142231726 [Haematobia irritans]|uniref:uncharacterized protein LOC142231726 n=1 Tax=Haematobia irritans TaxID=7368 RepID=UPI003F50B38C
MQRCQCFSRTRHEISLFRTNISLQISSVRTGKMTRFRRFEDLTTVCKYINTNTNPCAHTHIHLQGKLEQGCKKRICSTKTTVVQPCQHFKVPFHPHRYHRLVSDTATLIVFCHLYSHGSILPSLLLQEPFYIL